MGPGHVRSRDKRKHEVWPALEAPSTSQHRWSQQTYVDSMIHKCIWTMIQRIRIGIAESRYASVPHEIEKARAISQLPISLGHHTVI